MFCGAMGPRLCAAKSAKKLNTRDLCQESGVLNIIFNLPRTRTSFIVGRRSFKVIGSIVKLWFVSYSYGVHTYLRI